MISLLHTLINSITLQSLLCQIIHALQLLLMLVPRTTWQLLSLISTSMISLSSKLYTMQRMSPLPKLNSLLSDVALTKLLTFKKSLKSLLLQILFISQKESLIPPFCYKMKVWTDFRVRVKILQQYYYQSMVRERGHVTSQSHNIMSQVWSSLEWSGRTWSLEGLGRVQGQK